MREEAFHSDEVLVVRRNRWTIGLAASPILLGVLAFLLPHPFGLFFGINLAALGMFSLNYVWRKNPWSHSLQVRTHADKERATIGAFTLPREAMKDALLLPRGGKRPLVRLARKNWLLPAVELELLNEGEARRFLRAIGLDASQTVASFWLPSRILAHRGKAAGVMLGMMAAIIAISSEHRLLGLQTITPIVFMFFMLFFVVPSTLRVGVDGILISWFGRKRFVRHADIEMLSTYEDGFGKSRYLGIDLLLTSGEVIKIPINQSGWEDGQVEIIEERIREAKGTMRPGPRAGDTAFLLGRDGRSVTDWMVSLRAIGSGANATHRVAPIAPETLWQILEDPTAEASARAAAAVALRTELDVEGRARMQAAASATVAPKVRVVLETAAGTAEEEELALALASIEEAESKS